jgi:uncharacterized protein (TIGR00369 family)
MIRYPEVAGYRLSPEVAMTTEEFDPQALLEMMPLARTLGIRIDTVTRDEAVGRLAWSADLCTAAGMLHGGVLVSLADSVAGLCAFVNLPRGASTSTIELKTNFFAAVRDGEVVAVARPLHRGRSVIVVQTDLYRVEPAPNLRVAQVTQTQAVLMR